MLLTNQEKYEKMVKATNPYGNGFASKYIVYAIIKKYKEKKLGEFYEKNIYNRLYRLHWQSHMR